MESVNNKDIRAKFMLDHMSIAMKSRVKDKSTTERPENMLDRDNYYKPDEPHNNCQCIFTLIPYQEAFFANRS